MSSTAIATYENGVGTSLSLYRTPEEVLEEAKKAAKALVSVVDQKPKKVMFNGEQYLEREDWGTVAKFYGCTPKVIETRYVSFGEVHGWEAVAVCIDRNLNEIGRAESMCLSDEANWGAVPVYEWVDDVDANGQKQYITVRGERKVKRKKVQTGTTPKPLFQLRSMAQTRAEAKVLKSIFGWVVVLAGYRPSVAEEMTGNEQGVNAQEEDHRGHVEPPRVQLLTISGEIEQVEEGKEGSRWLILDKKTVHMFPKFWDDAMKPGARLTVKVQEFKKGDTVYYGVAEVVADAQEGELVNDEPSAESKVNLNDLYEKGDVKHGAAADGNGGKVIGKSRAVKLYTTMTKFKDKNGGLTEAILKSEVLSKMDPPLEHLSDLPIDLFDQLEKIAKGEIDWRTLAGDDVAQGDSPAQ